MLKLESYVALFSILGLLIHSFISEIGVMNHRIKICASLLLEDKQWFNFGSVMSEQNTHSYITFSILNCCLIPHVYVIWWVFWVYRWFKHRYGNRDEKVHKTEHFGAKKNLKRKTVRLFSNTTQVHVPWQVIKCKASVDPTRTWFPNYQTSLILTLFEQLIRNVDNRI